MKCVHRPPSGNVKQAFRYMCLEFKQEDLSEEIVWESIYPTCDIIRYEKGHTTSFKKCLPNK